MNEKEPCSWCRHMNRYRFEFNWIDDDGHTVTTNNEVIGGIADFCPVCGRKLYEDEESAVE